ncbi:MAG TPA: Uma2 family endonuclease [Ktedonobacterales bacterium]|nr:Uma2 family endonuclease [Ktedonobacterales bacterium]
MQQQEVLWGERVAGAPHPFKVADLATLPDDTWQYEIVDGELIRMPGSGYDASKFAVRLLSAIFFYAEAHNLGEVTGPDGIYNLTRPGDTRDTALGPDAAFVQTARLPGRTPGYAKLAPDLVAEMVSPSQYRPEMAKKAKLYIERDVRLVWIIWPSSQTADIWRPSSPSAPVMTLTIADSLDGLDVLPGFSYPLATLLR